MICELQYSESVTWENPDRLQNMIRLSIRNLRNWTTHIDFLSHSSAFRVHDHSGNVKLFSGSWCHFTQTDMHVMDIIKPDHTSTCIWYWNCIKSLACVAKRMMNCSQLWAWSNLIEQVHMTDAYAFVSSFSVPVNLKRTSSTILSVLWNIGAQLVNLKVDGSKPPTAGQFLHLIPIYSPRSCPWTFCIPFFHY